MEIYSEKLFINQAIEHGIDSYILNKNGEHYNKMYKFEMLIISALTIIYGEKSILLPYKIDNEKAFECNLLMYDLKDTDLKKFISYMQKYYDFMEEFKSEKMAEGIIEEIEKIIIEMLKKRSKVKKLTNDELEKLGRIFDNNCSFNSMFSNNNVNIIKRYWLDTKENLTDTQIEMIGINPNLLSREEYSTYGFDIRTIACLSAYEISEVNNAIEENKKQKFQKEEVSFFKKFNLYLTTGSGFVDKLMLLSIVATELMVGIIVLFQLGGK